MNNKKEMKGSEMGEEREGCKNGERQGKKRMEWQWENWEVEMERNGVEAVFVSSSLPPRSWP